MGAFLCGSHTGVPKRRKLFRLVHGRVLHVAVREHITLDIELYWSLCGRTGVWEWFPAKDGTVPECKSCVSIETAQMRQSLKIFP